MSDITDWRVLLVDDEPDSLNLIHDILALQNIEVQCVDNGADGLLLLKHFAPTLVIVDLSMPKPDGWDILSAIRSEPSTSDLPVVAITAYSSDKVAVQARQAGFSALLPKPIRANNLLSKLQEIVE